MKPVYIGTYMLGAENVRLELGNGVGGYFIPAPKGGRMATIGIGRDVENWWSVVGVLMHEALELSFYRSGLRWTANPDYSSDNGGYLFSMDHVQFSEASARAAHFITPALPELAKAWKKHRKKNRK